MGRHLLLAVRFHGDGQGHARYHGVWQGAPEWPPAPARIFQALVAGAARGDTVPQGAVDALEWLERLPPPVIAAPIGRRGERVTLFVPNNDADAVDDPRDVSGIRTKKIVHPVLMDEDVPLLYAWPLEEEGGHSDAIVEAANDLYQLGRGVDMAWASGEVLGDEALDERLRVYPGAIRRPVRGDGGESLPCPIPGSFASLQRRHGTTKLRREGRGRAARVLFTNPPKARFLSVAYTRALHRVVYDLRDREDDTRSWRVPSHRAVLLVETIRDAAADRLRASLPDKAVEIEQTLIGRKADGSDPSPIENRVRIIPIPSVGHTHADNAIRRVVLEVPSGAAIAIPDVEWAFSGLEPADMNTGVVGPFVLVRAENDDILRRHYRGPTRRWRSVTAIAVPEKAGRRRIEPTLRREEAKAADERIAEESRAVAAVHVALRQAGVRAVAVSVKVQREPFEGKGSRAERFADVSRFAKERLWHVDLELDRSIEGPLVVGDGRFLGLGLLAPVREPWASPATDDERPGGYRVPFLGLPRHRAGLTAFSVEGGPRGESIGLARALRCAVLARVQAEIGPKPLERFFSGHEKDGSKAKSDGSTHLAFQWDPAGKRLLIISPHWLDRREPTAPERRAMQVLSRALEGFVELRAGSAGRFAVCGRSLGEDDPMLVPSHAWQSISPYAVTRHSKGTSPAEVLKNDVAAECARRGLPRPKVMVSDARGVAGRGLEGRVRLEFSVAIHGPLLLGRTRYLGGGLLAPVE